MEQLITAFGIDAKLIIIQILNFVVLMGLMSYLLYKPVLKILSEREEKIKKGILDAEEAAKARESAEVDRKGVLTTAHREAEEINLRARAHAEEKASEILTGAQSDANKVLIDAKEKIEQMKAQARAESEGEIARLAILAAEKVLKEKA